MPPRRFVPTVLEPVVAPPAPPVDLSTVPLEVRATQLGFYGNQRRRTGDVFTLAKPEDFAATWMVDANEPVAAVVAPKDSLPWLRKQHQQIMAGDTPTLQHNAADLEPEDDEPGQPTGAADVI